MKERPPFIADYYNINNDAVAVGSKTFTGDGVNDITDTIRPLAGQKMLILAIGIENGNDTATPRCDVSITNGTRKVPINSGSLLAATSSMYGSAITEEPYIITRDCYFTITIGGTTKMANTKTRYVTYYYILLGDG